MIFELDMQRWSIGVGTRYDKEGRDLKEVVTDLVYFVVGPLWLTIVWNH